MNVYLYLPLSMKLPRNIAAGELNSEKLNLYSYQS